MKNIQTLKVDSFTYWRLNNIHKYGNFNWLQLNYNPNTADIMHIIIEIKDRINTAPEYLKDKIEKQLKEPIPIFILDFNDPKSKYYVDLNTLHKKIGLTINEYYLKNIKNIKSYWEYRLYTKPQNCLTADIDVLEYNNKLNFMIIEAAELYDTKNINEAIKHIFKTFKFRKNQVNELQYKSHIKFATLLKTKAYILFHEIERENKKLKDDTYCLLLDNNNFFIEMLIDIKQYGKNDLDKFFNQYKYDLIKKIKQFNNIYDTYKYLNILTLQHSHNIMQTI